MHLLKVLLTADGIASIQVCDALIILDFSDRREIQKIFISYIPYPPLINETTAFAGTSVTLLIVMQYLLKMIEKMIIITFFSTGSILHGEQMFNGRT